jgi:hypothetical protein
MGGCVIDTITSHTLEECAHSPSWPSGLIIVIFIIIIIFIIFIIIIIIMGQTS